MLIRRYDLPDHLLTKLKESGYKRPTPIQMQAIPVLMHVNIPSNIG